MIVKFNEILEQKILTKLADGQDDKINQFAFMNLAPEYFHNCDHRDIYKIMLDAYTNHNSFNAVDLASKVINDNPALFSIVEGFITNLYNPMYNFTEQDIHQLKNLHDFNLTLKNVHKILSQFKNLSGTQADLKQLQIALSDASETKTINHQSGTRLTDLVDLHHYDDEKDELIKTGINDLDTYLGGGFYKGTVCALVAEPGVGKTYYGMHLLDELLQTNPDTQALFFSIEMKKKRLYPRFLSLKAKKFFDRCTQKERDDAGIQLKLTNMTIYDSADEPDCANIEFIRMASILESKRMPISAILVDYLGIVQTSKNSEAEHLRIHEIMRQLVPLSMQLNCVIFVLVHSNRGSQNRNPYDRAPTQYEEASSQASFRSSHYWIGLDKPIRHAPTDKRVRDLFVLRCVKNRDYPPFYINTRFENGTFSKNYYPYNPDDFFNKPNNTFD